MSETDGLIVSEGQDNERPYLISGHLQTLVVTSVIYFCDVVMEVIYSCDVRTIQAGQ